MYKTHTETTGVIMEDDEEEAADPYHHTPGLRFRFQTREKRLAN